MEKYGQYRDKGSGIAPFFPISPPATSVLLLPWNAFLFFLRIPFLVFAWFVWLAFTQWTPPGTLLRKANLWCIIGIPGIWWIDLQVDGVRRGSLGKSPGSHMPEPGSIVAASHTSPIDILYLATILDPIFTQSYPGTKLVKPLTLLSALASCFSLPTPPKDRSGLLPLSKLVSQHPGRIIATFPEATPSNGRSILTLTPSLLSASPKTKIYPVSLRYTPADIVTPIPGLYSAISFFWTLLSTQTHCIRTRIGAHMRVPAADAAAMNPMPTHQRASSFESNYFDTLSDEEEAKKRVQKDEDGITETERRVLDMFADTLARLGRVKRVSLGIREKAKFVEAWTKGAKGRRA